MLDGRGERLCSRVEEEIINMIHGGNDVGNGGDTILREEEHGGFVDF